MKAKCFSLFCSITLDYFKINMCILLLKEDRTEALKLLTEADLIDQMEKHDIGTDATHAEHIKTIKERQYAHVTPQGVGRKLLGLGGIRAAEFPSV